ncbi:hypothetical protein MATL_G00157130 [Megalops atlanticus]|uniref:Consortin n=1 Tax=Megalops atlanticus TaxID=7932 RepID=A0A9D3PPZ1_MEGAT|nr:hypothetical protein MATL_G00157130 [Megalops atlanticus]
MEDRLSRSEEAVRRGLGGARDLCNSVDHDSLSLSSSDENQNRLQEEEKEEEEGEEEAGEERLQEGRKLHQQDSVNNNEETDNDYRACLRQPETWSQVPPTTKTQQDGDTEDVREVSPSEPPAAFTPSPMDERPEGSPGPSPSSLVASLLELQDHCDHPRLPQCLHQIAEAYFLEEDYERAFQFIQLERLYHERLLSNLAALQEQWESRWKACRQTERSSKERARTDLGSEPLETLRRICRTHRRPSLGAEKHAVADSEPKNSLTCWRWTGEERLGDSLLPCSADSGTESPQLMEEQLGIEDVPLAQGVVQPAAPGAVEKDTSTLNHQRAPQCNSDSSPALVATPTPAVPGSHFTDETVRVGGDEVGPAGETEPHTDAGPEGLHGDQLTDSSSQEGAVPVTPPLESLPHETGPQTEQGDSMDMGLPGAGKGVTEMGDTPTDGAEDSGGVEEGQGPSVGGYMSQLYTERLEMGLGVEVEKDRKKAVGANGPEEFREGEEETALDDLARRIQVEEITPAAGLVSILKRRASLEGAPPRPPAPPKQVPKRKVRFREPEEAMDHDEVGGDSWLLLLLLCMATVVISVGGTALYCTLGNAQSSVCTDFSRNVDFYFSQVQRGIEELRQWLSPGS